MPLQWGQFITPPGYIKVFNTHSPLSSHNVRNTNKLSLAWKQISM